MLAEEEEREASGFGNFCEASAAVVDAEEEEEEAAVAAIEAVTDLRATFTFGARGGMRPWYRRMRCTIANTFAMSSLSCAPRTIAAITRSAAARTRG